MGFEILQLKKKRKPSSIIKKEEMQVHGDLSVRELNQTEAITQIEVLESTVVPLVGCIFGIGMKFTEGIQSWLKPTSS